jgi:hypothetical protein
VRGPVSAHERREHVRVEHVPVLLWPDHCAPAVPHRDQAALGERPLTLPDHAGAHAELPGELGQRRQPLALHHRAAGDVAEQHEHHLAVEGGHALS